MTDNGEHLANYPIEKGKIGSTMSTNAFDVSIFVVLLKFNTTIGCKVAVF